MSDSYYMDWSTADRMELIWTLLGKELGTGAFRKVFTCPFDPSVVIKIEQRENEFHNVREWHLWQELQWTDEPAQWFAPCVYISPCGRVLVQKRTTPMSPEELEDLAPKIPRFFSDVKAANWGRFDDRPVCHDYAYNLMLDDVHSARWWKMRDADWLDE